MNLIRARLALSSSPTMPTADVVGASVLHLTDGVTSVSEAGPWPANAPRDVFVKSDYSAIQSEPWHDRSASPIPISSFGDYLGSINPDANGQLNWHVTLGAARRCDVWNTYNQIDISLLVADGADNQKFTSAQNNWTPITPNSFGTFVMGLPGYARAMMRQSVYALAGPTGGSAWGVIAIGWGEQFAKPVPWTWPTMTDQPPGYWGQIGADNWAGGAVAPSAAGVAEYEVNGFVGAETVYAVACANEAGINGSWVQYDGKNAPVERYMTIGPWRG